MGGRFMRALNLEDNAIKHSKIKRCLNECGYRDVDWVRNLEDGLKSIEEAIESGAGYDVIITDMWYPLQSGGKDHDSGADLIAELSKRGITIPVIICSTIQYRFDEIYGAIQCKDSVDWEMELKNMLRSIGK